jgi:DnaK suppressor protein
LAQKRKKTSPKKTGSAWKKKIRMGKADIEHFKQMLLNKRRELVGDVNGMENEVLKKSRLSATGDLSSMPIHMADIGSDNYEQEFILGLMDSERKLLREIDGALQRIEEGTYGICEATGQPISRVRLEAIPWARYCVEYVRKLEEGLATESEES